MRVEEGEDPQIIGTFQDITELKLAEEALRETRENFRTFFETMDDIIIVGEPDGKIIYSNLAVSLKLGYTPEGTQDYACARLASGGKTAGG